MFAIAAGALAQAPETPAPEIAACTVMVPVLTVDAQTRDVGHMFAAEIGGKRVFVTAQSLFGPAGGFAAPIPGADLAPRVTRVVARDAYDTGTECGFSTTVLPVPDATPMGGVNDASRDVAVFAVGVPQKGSERRKAAKNPPLAPLAFASAAPSVGDAVYLLAPVRGGSAQKTAGEVVEVREGSMYFQYEDATLDLTGTVGAPVVNAEGQVVGINLGAGKMDDGTLIGAASPLGPTRQRVEAAAEQATVATPRE